jgi:anti-anti-sigma regulatory factor
MIYRMLADDVVFHSPVVHTPQVGKAVTLQYLSAAFNVFFNMNTTQRNVIEPETADSYEIGAKTAFFDNKLILNLADVPYIDSAGLGEIVRTYTTVSRQGGALKLLALTKRITDLLAITKLLTIFETFDAEAEAVNSFGPAGAWRSSSSACRPPRWFAPTPTSPGKWRMRNTAKPRQPKSRPR